MNENELKNSRDLTRDRIKSAALKLFSKYGVDGVSVRSIIVESGLKNSASINYYFGTKEALVKEIVVDVTKDTDKKRNKMLNEIEESGREISLREIIEILAYTSINPYENSEDGPLPMQSKTRFVTMLQLTHLKLFNEALEKEWNTGYLRCLNHMRNILSEIPPEILNQRFIFMSLMLSITLSSREEAMLTNKLVNRFWGNEYVLSNLIDSVCGMLSQPISNETSRIFNS